MLKLRRTIFALLATLFSPFLGTASADRPAGRPNILLILIDDMGMVDVGCYGATYHETPNIDKLASQGMRFTDAYAACCVCSPTRAALLTGRSPVATGITDWIPGYRGNKTKLKVPAFNQELPLEEVTLAEALKPAGYVCGSIGKWHLGGPAFYPEKQGFDVNIAGTDKGQPASYFSPYKIATLSDGPPGEYITDRLTTEAEKFIEQNKDRPFFLYLPHFAVHTPIQPKKDLQAKYAAKPAAADQKNPAYAAMVESVDDSVGRLMKKLDELKLAENTLVVFTSDNGGLSQVNDKRGPASNIPLRGGKGTLYEGGIREPLLVRLPGVIQPGSVCKTPVISQDLFSTILDLAGAEKPAGRAIDGISLWPLLKQTGTLDRKELLWHYPHYHPGGATPGGAIRSGDWKLIEYFEDGRMELFDLKADPFEKSDLSKTKPEVAARLQKRLSAWRVANHASMPAPNPAYQQQP